MPTRAKLARKYSPYLDTVIGGATFTVGAEASNIINVAVQLKDGNGVALSQVGAVRGWLASDAAGRVPLTSPPNTYIQAGTNGNLVPGSNYPLNSLMVVGALAIDAVPEKFKTTATAVYTVGGQTLTKAAATAIVFSSAHVVNATKFGVILVQINAAGTVSTKVPLSPQVYTTAPLALAALPAPDAGNVALGYIAIAAGAGNWTANTDDMTNGSDLTTAMFVDVTPASAVPLSFTLLSNASGQVDVNIKDTTARTFYMALQMADGTVVVSGAITFA